MRALSAVDVADADGLDGSGGGVGGGVGFGLRMMFAGENAAGGEGQDDGGGQGGADNRFHEIPFREVSDEVCMRSSEKGFSISTNMGVKNGMARKTKNTVWCR